MAATLDSEHTEHERWKGTPMLIGSSEPVAHAQARTYAT